LQANSVGVCLEIEWDSTELDPRWEEEEPQEVVNEEVMYDTLGLKNEFERGVDGTSVDGWKNDYGGA
jgi:hypothetical protein